MTNNIPNITDREREEAVARYRVLEKPLLDVLAKAGVNVLRLHDLGSAHPNYQSSIGILINHLKLDYPPAILVGIAAALATKKARSLAWDEVKQLYLRQPNLPRERPPGEIGLLSEPKDQMARALAEMSGRADFEDIISLISDPRNGPSRIFFVSALRRTRSPKAIEVLGRLSEDPDLSKEITHSLSKYLRAKALHPKN